MAMEEDPAKINDADRQIQARLYEQAQSYAETRVQSRKLNKQRAESRAKIMEMGFRSDSYQTGIRIIKDLSARERDDFMRDLNLILKVLGSRQADLFPEEALKAAKREEQRKAENQPKPPAEADAKSDANPRSNPAKGGAGKKKADKNPPVASVPPTEAELTAAAAQAATEQQEGDQALNAGLSATKKAQSKQAADKLAAAGI